MTEQAGRKDTFKLQNCPMSWDGTEKLVAKSPETELSNDLPGCLKKQERDWEKWNGTQILF